MTAGTVRIISPLANILFARDYKHLTENTDLTYPAQETDLGDFGIHDLAPYDEASALDHARRLSAAVGYRPYPTKIQRDFYEARTKVITAIKPYEITGCRYDGQTRAYPIPFETLDDAFYQADNGSNMLVEFTPQTGNLIVKRL